MITENISINLKNCKKKYTFLHISDVHAACLRDGDSESERANTEKSILEWTRDGVTPTERFKEFVKFASDLLPDAVILSGDAIELCREKNIDFLKECFEQIKCPVLFTSGNHERYGLEGAPHHHYYTELMQGSPELWCKDFGELLVIGIDNSDKRITCEQLEQLDNLLSEGRPVIITMHIPLITDDLRDKIADFWGEEDVDYFEFGGSSSDDTVRAFADKIRQSDNILAVLTGHVHFAHRDMLSETTEQFVAAPFFEGFVRLITVE